MPNTPKATLLKAISQSKLTDFRDRLMTARPPEIPPGLIPAYICLSSLNELTERAEIFRHAWSPLND